MLYCFCQLEKRKWKERVGKLFLKCDVMDFYLNDGNPSEDHPKQPYAKFQRPQNQVETSHG